MNYIVKSCPSCRYTPKRYIDGIDYICWNAQNFNSSARGLCQDCTDCVMKQVVEKCKKEIKIYRNTLLPNDGTNTLHFGRQSFAYDILQLLDIQEVE